MRTSRSLAAESGHLFRFISLTFYFISSLLCAAWWLRLCPVRVLTSFRTSVTASINMHVGSSVLTLLAVVWWNVAHFIVIGKMNCFFLSSRLLPMPSLTATPAPHPPRHHATTSSQPLTTPIIFSHNELGQLPDWHFCAQWCFCVLKLPVIHHQFSFS